MKGDGTRDAWFLCFVCFIVFVHLYHDTTAERSQGSHRLLLYFCSPFHHGGHCEEICAFVFGEKRNTGFVAFPWSLNFFFFWISKEKA